MEENLMFPLKVFVYGTLKRGYGNNRRLEDSEFIGEAISHDTYVMRDVGYPMITKNSKGSPVVGELFKVDKPSILRSLDALEGHPNFYTRVVRRFTDEHGNIHHAWVYEIIEDINAREWVYALSTPNEKGLLEWQRK